MAEYKTIAMNKLIFQGLAIEQRIAEIYSQEEPKNDIKPIYSLGIFEDNIFDDIDQITSFCYLEYGVILPISKFEYIGTMGNMTNVIKEQNSMDQVRYYSYIDNNNFYICDESEAITNKLATWQHINGNITRIYEEFEKKGAVTKKPTSERVLQLKNN